MTAILARAAKNDIVRGHRVAAAVGHALDRRFEGRVLERLDLAAVVTHEVVVMVAAGVRRLEARDSITEVDALDEPELVHAIERAVHAGDADPAPPIAYGVVELLRGKAAVLFSEQLDHELSRAAAAPARLAETGERGVRPCHHDDNDTCSQRRASVSRVRRVALLAAVAAVAVLAGCGGSSQANDGRRTVVAGFYPLAWAAERIAGSGVRVVDLTPAGAEPHDLELTPRDLETIRDADLVLYLGGGFQPALAKAVADRSERSLDLLDTQQLLRGGEGGSVDPHVWLDPSRLARIAIAIGAALGRERAAAHVAAELGRLDDEYRSGLSTCRRHELVTSHAAFGYLAKRYGLRQLALTGLAPEAEPSPKDLEMLVDEVRKTDARAVFSETLVSSRLAETVAREAGVATATLDPLEGLTDDEAAAGEDYIARMRWNLATLRKALECR